MSAYWSPSKTVRRAFKKLIRRTQRLADGVIYARLHAAPLALVALLVVAVCGVRLQARSRTWRTSSRPPSRSVCNSRLSESSRRWREVCGSYCKIAGYYTLARAFCHGHDRA